MTIDHTPPSADELRGLESMCAVLHAATETDPVVKDVAWRAFALIRAHRSLIETAHNQARMLGEITDACMAAEGDALRHRTQVAELSALLCDPDRLADHLQQLRSDLAEQERDAEIDRLADGGEL